MEQKEQNTVSPELSRRRRWRMWVSISALVILAALCITVLSLYAYESRPRVRTCRERFEKLKDLIERYVIKSKNDNFPPREGNNLLKALSVSEEKEEKLIDPNERPEQLDFFLCPFTDTKRGGTDFEGWDFSLARDVFYGLPVLWEKKVNHHGGRHVIICDKTGALEVKFLSEKEFRKAITDLEKKKKETASTNQEK